jgi:ABC-type cobalamin/Fe3+-siderophores transport system ATPase subunit
VAAPVRPTGAVVAGLAILALLLAAALGWQLDGRWWLAAVPVVALLLVHGHLARQAASPADGRRAHEDAFGRCGVAGPERWDVAAVEQRVVALERELAAAWRAVEDARLRTALEAERPALEREGESLAAERARLVARAGFDAGTGGLHLATLAGSLRRWADARVEHAGAAATLREVERRIESDTEAVVAHLRAFDAPVGSRDAAALVAAVESLRAREQRRATAARDRAAAQLRLEEQTRERAEAASRVAEVFRRCGLAPDDDAALDRQLELLPRRAAALRDLDRAMQSLADAAAALASRPDVRELQRPMLEAAREQQQALAARADALRAEVATLEAELRHARAGTALSEALAAEQAARDAFRDRAEDGLFAAAGRFLLGEVERRHTSAGLPAVARRAAAWFSAFTHHEWALDVDPDAPDGGAFRAIDTATNARRALHELSTGTRLQLLLAARLAFAMDAERGEALPIFLDEVLTTSDPDRTTKVAEALHVLAREGRQVIYVTANPRDAQALRAADGDVTVVDLGAARGLAGRVPSPASLAVPTPELPPPPGDDTPERYGHRIGVTPLDPREAPGAAHLFHLLRHDLGLLHRLLRRHLSRLGQLANVLDDATLVRSYGLETEASGLRTLVAAMRAFCEARQIGAGRPLTREVLQEAGVSDRFIERIAELAGELGWSARRLLDAIDRGEDERVRGFRRRTREEMEEWLEAAGYLDPRPRLDDEAVVQWVFRAVGPPDGVSADVLEARLREWIHLTGAAPDAPAVSPAA